MADKIREGDIEALRNKAKLQGNPIKSDLIRGKDGSLTHYKVRGKKKDKVEIISTDNDY